MEPLIVLLLVAAVALLVLLVVRSTGTAEGSASREAELRERLARAEASLASEQQQLAAFSHVSQQALAGQSAQLLQLAESRYGALSQHTSSLLGEHSERIRQALDALAQRLSTLERERSNATTSLETMVRELAAATEATRTEAAQLRAALNDSRVRGTWGEVQLRRVFELAGLDRHVDFVEQRAHHTDESTVRPDAIVALPNGRVVVVDSKAPLDRYLEAVNTDDDTRRAELYTQHAAAVAAHVSALASRRYRDAVEGSVDFVVLFLPGDAFLAAALDASPALFEQAAAKGVVLATPSSLLPLLRGVAAGWRERRAEEAAADIQRLGAELHERIAVFLDSYLTVGTRLTSAVEAYNRSVGSLESRLVVTARKLAERGAGSARGVPDLHQIPTVVRPISLPELEPSDAPAAVEGPPFAEVGPGGAGGSPSVSGG